MFYLQISKQINMSKTKKVVLNINNRAFYVLYTITVY